MTESRDLTPPSSDSDLSFASKLLGTWLWNDCPGFPRSWTFPREELRQVGDPVGRMVPSRPGWGLKSGEIVGVFIPLSL